MPSRSSQQGQELDVISGDRLSSSNPVAPSQSGKALNKDRFKTMLANKQGGVKARISAQREPNLAFPKQSVRNTQAGFSLEGKPPAFSIGQRKLVLGSSGDQRHLGIHQQDACSSAPRGTPISAASPNGSTTQPPNGSNSDASQDALGKTRLEHTSTPKTPKSEGRKL